MASLVSLSDPDFHFSRSSDQVRQFTGLHLDAANRSIHPKQKMKQILLGISFVCALVGAWSVTPEAQAVGTRRVALRSGSDFSSGELEGVAIDSVGRVRAGFSLGSVAVPDATTAWSVLKTRSGSVLIGSGNDGRLLEYSGGAVKEVAKVEALAITSIAEAWGGSIIVSALPGGKLYEYKAGKLSEWLDIKEAAHIMELAYDAQNQVLYAASGAEGKLFRVTRDKKAQVYFDSEEEHLVSVAVGNGKVYAGGGDKAKLYEITGPGRASVLHDFGRTEVRAIAVGKSGDVFAIANELKTKRALPDKPDDGDEAKPSSPSRSAPKGKGTLFRFDKNGAPEQLLDDSSEHYTSLSLDAEGNPYVGTGAEGKLYTVDGNRNSVLVADVEERQVTALLLAGQERIVFASDPLVVRPVRGVGTDAMWTSAVIDAGLRAHFGRLDWRADGQLELSTRTGNSEEPDDTWSDWSQPLLQAGDIKSPAARFFQVRARFSRDPNAVLSEVEIPFVTDNLRAMITSVEFENTASKALSSPDDKLVASGGPLTGSPDDEVEIKWKVDNPDKDELRYWLKYRQEGTSEWFDILEPREKLTKTSYSWKTADLPEGRYRVSVIANDSLANPPGAVHSHELQSHVVLIDNTPPQLTGLKVTGRTVTGTAVDGVGPIARIEVAVAGTDEWVPAAPLDGVFDEAQEEFSVDLSTLVPPGAALLTVRAYDQEKNQVVGNVSAR